jgi:hypothetical protein
VRLIDLVTPEILEKAIHWPIPDDPEAAKKLDADLKADQANRLSSVRPLAEVLGKCLMSCGPIVPDVELQQQLFLQHITLAAIDAAIELAAKESA